MGYKKTVYLATFFSEIKCHSKAISTLKNGLDTLTDKRERSSVMINIGMELTKIKKYKEAVKYFHKGLSMVENEVLEYHPTFIYILKIIRDYGENGVYQKWYYNFINRVSYDKKFKRIIKKCDEPVPR